MTERLIKMFGMYVKTCKEERVVDSGLLLPGLQEVSHDFVM
jgi:hypothetical protein